MFNVKYNDFRKFLSDKITNTVDFKQAVSISLGICISRLLPIPTGIVESASNHYDNNLFNVTNLYINDFNENVVIVDINLVKQITRSFWLIRYTAAYPDSNLPIVPTGQYSFLDKLFKSNIFTPSEIVKYLDNNSEVISVIINRMVNIVKDTDTSVILLN